jgi:hypothetical protein
MAYHGVCAQRQVFPHEAEDDDRVTFRGRSAQGRLVCLGPEDDDYRGLVVSGERF